MVEFPDVVIVHTLAHTLAALEISAELNTPIVLQNASGALLYTGGLYLLNMFAQARAAHPKADAIFILDCGAAGAETVSAMQAGHTHIRSGAADALRTKLEDIARHLGITFVTGAYTALDLAHTYDAKKACREWLVALE